MKRTRSVNCRPQGHRKESSMPTGVYPHKPSPTICGHLPHKAHGLCRGCYNKIHGASYRAANVEKVRDRKATYAQANPERLRAYHAAYYAAHHGEAAAYATAHRERIRASGKARYVAHPEKQRAASAAYFAIHAEEKRAYQRVYGAAYRAAHPEEERARNAARRAAHREERRASDAAYHAAHPEQAREKSAMRRAAKRNLPTEHIAIASLYLRDKGRCGICKKPVGRATASIDHIIPLSRGGSHTYGNVQLAHLICNLRRGAGRLPAQARFF